MNRQPRRDNRQAPRQRHNISRSSGDNTVNSSIAPGLSVAIVQKHDQPTGRLTYGVVAETLTGSAVHPRGIKVRLTDGTVGRVQHIQPANVKFPTSQASAGNTKAEDFQPPPPSTTSLLDWIQPSLRVPNDSSTSPPHHHDHTFDANATNDVDDDDRPAWSCSVCTFENSGFLVACEMCQATK